MSDLERVGEDLSKERGPMDLKSPHKTSVAKNEGAVGGSGGARGSN